MKKIQLKTAKLSLKKQEVKSLTGGKYAQKDTVNCPAPNTVSCPSCNYTCVSCNCGTYV